MDLTRNARIIPIKPQNQVRSVKKLANGDLEVTQHSGNVFVVNKDDENAQVFVIWSVLNGGF